MSNQIKLDQIYLQAQNIKENAYDKQKVEQMEQVQTGVPAGHKGRETALTWAPREKI